MFDPRLFLPKPPMWMIAIAILFVVGSWIPLTAIFKYTQSKHEKPRIHLFQDMDNQPKLKAQAASPIFADGRAMRPEVPGTIRRGELRDDTEFELGYTVKKDGDSYAPVFISGMPDAAEVDQFFLARGQKKFDTFCYPCHGKAGYGDGPVNQRATELVSGDQTLSYGTQWVPSANLNNVQDGKLQFGADVYPNGQLFNVITHGKANMAGYGHAIPVEDRWAIVAYVRALQLSQNAGAAKVAMDLAANSNTQTAEANELGVTSE
ncbi:c-type cytochrome [Algisphaera agarilytica]|uniref:Mono/diheme cytochrome c family protein n=1 Tax=Algisphaera agarilytica TaxID=1385975 RepID=A0A7X0H5D8_9BACT|nr:cytochrome c [Algisphaera agarilytica]MBB6429448.1 mono/diheme cytochrome c family protein [Algisphaera agarilytica]